MLTLAMRTDKVLAELYIYSGDKLIDKYSWEAHKKLSNTLHTKIDGLLTSNNLVFKDLQRVAVYQGPGSFTGLRIGISTANAIAYSLGIPVLAYPGDLWLKQCLDSSKRVFEPISPEYGSEPNITKPRK